MRRANIKPYLTPKVDYILKLSNYYVTTQITHVFRTKVQMLTPFLEIDPAIWHTCSMSPHPSVGGFFFAGNFGSPKTQISKKKKTGKKYLAGKKEKSNRQRLGRGSYNTRAKFHGIFQKNSVNIGC